MDWLRWHLEKHQATPCCSAISNQRFLQGKAADVREIIIPHRIGCISLSLSLSFSLVHSPLSSASSASVHVSPSNCWSPRVHLAKRSRSHGNAPKASKHPSPGPVRQSPRHPRPAPERTSESGGSGVNPVDLITSIYPIGHRPYPQKVVKPSKPTETTEPQEVGQEPKRDRSIARELRPPRVGLSERL